MKKIILLITNIVLLVALTNAQYLGTQKISHIKPTLIVWNVNGEKLTLKDAKKGITTPDEITLEIYIDSNYVKKYSNLSFDVMWFYYLSTRRKLMSTKKINLSMAEKDGDAYIFKVKFSNLTKGWWEAQIIAQTDKGYLQFGNLTRFQIYLK